MIISRINVPPEPSILLGVRCNGADTIVLCVPCREDIEGQLAEMELYLTNLKLVGICGRRRSGIAEVELVGGVPYLILESKRVEIITKEVDLRNFLFCGIGSARAWVDVNGTYMNRSTRNIDDGNIVRSLSSSLSSCQSCVCLKDSTLGDVLQFVRELPDERHVVRLKLEGVVLERRFEVEPSVTTIRQSFLKAFGLKLNRSNVVCGVALATNQTKATGTTEPQQSRVWIWTILAVVTLFLALLMVG